MEITIGATLAAVCLPAIFRDGSIRSNSKYASGLLSYPRVVTPNHMGLSALVHVKRNWSATAKNSFKTEARMGGGDKFRAGLGISSTCMLMFGAQLLWQNLPLVKTAISKMFGSLYSSLKSAPVGGAKPLHTVVGGGYAFWSRAFNLNANEWALNLHAGMNKYSLVSIETVNYNVRQGLFLGDLLLFLVVVWVVHTCFYKARTGEKARKGCENKSSQTLVD